MWYLKSKQKQCKVPKYNDKINMTSLSLRARENNVFILFFLDLKNINSPILANLGW